MTLLFSFWVCRCGEPFACRAGFSARRAIARPDGGIARQCGLSAKHSQHFRQQRLRRGAPGPLYRTMFARDVDAGFSASAR